MRDERLSPMTYKKLRELGYDENKWQNLTQEQANKIVAQHNTSTAKSSSNVKTEKTEAPKLSAQQIDDKIKDLQHQLKFRGDRLDKYQNAYDDIVSKYSGSDGGPNNIYLKAFLSSVAGIDKFGYKVPAHRDGRIHGLKVDKSEQLKTAPQYEDLRKFVSANAPVVRKTYNDLIEGYDNKLREQIKQLESMKSAGDDEERKSNVEAARKRGISTANSKWYNVSENDIQPDTAYYFGYINNNDKYFEGDSFTISRDDDGEYQIDATTEVPARSYKTKLEAYNAALDSIMPDEGRIKISTHYEDI